MKSKKALTVEVVSVKTIADNPDELIIERMMQVSGATRIEAEWEAPQFVWNTEPALTKGQRAVRIRSGKSERRGVWLLTIEFIYKPRPVWASKSATSAS